MASSLGLLAAALAAPLRGQPLIRMGPWTGVAEVRFSVQEQDAESLTAPSSLFDRDRSEQRIALRNALTVISRRFLTIDYGFTLGLEQSQLRNDQRQDDGDGQVRAFDLTATLFPVSTRRLTLRYSQSENEVPVEFAGTRTVETGTLGLALGVGPGWLPGSLRLRQSRLETSASFGSFVRQVDQRRNGLSYTATGNWPRHQLQASYELEDFDDRIAPRFSHVSQTGSANHTFEILAPKLATLRSLVRFFERGGELGSSSFYLDELLRLQHRRNLATSIRYSVQQLSAFSGPTADSQRLRIGLDHRLFESLETALYVARDRTDGRGTRTELDELGLDATYRKRLPGGGRLTTRLVSRYERRDSLRGEGQELITGERHVLRFGIPERLDRPGALLGSVVVTDELRTTIFDQGIDYQLVAIGDFAEITTLPGGRIRDAEVVLVEYRVRSPAASRVAILRSSWNGTVDYGWIAPFWGYRSIDSNVLEGTIDRLLEGSRERFLGVRFRHRGRRLSFISLQELRTSDSLLQAFESLQFGENVTYHPLPRWTLGLRLVRIDTDFTLPVRTLRIREGRASVRWMPRPATSFEAFASRREVADTAAADQSFDRFGFEGRLTFGKITVLGSVQRFARDRTLNGQVAEHTEGLSASLILSRRFFPGRLSVARRRTPIEPWPADLPGLWSDPATMGSPAARAGGEEGGEQASGD